MNALRLSTRPYHVAVVGSRDFASLSLVTAYVNTLPVETVIVSGDARGVDRAAATAARMRGMPRPLEFIPDWRPNGVFDRSAGFRRNEDIVRAADLIVAFWDGSSPGTRNTIEHAKRLHKPYFVIDEYGMVSFV